MSSSASASPNFETLAFIGGGNMARSLISGMIAKGASPDSIHVADPIAKSREGLQRDFGIKPFAANADAIQGASLWVLAVKPQVMREICESLSSEMQATTLVISIAAGVTTVQIERWLGGTPAVIRGMPNTPALLGAGMTGLYANTHVTGRQREQAERLIASVGTSIWIDRETLMDTVTAISGSGPAYAFLLAEAMETAAVAEGLSPNQAHLLVQHTLLGAARMLVESGDMPAELRRKVTSPGGTTQAALDTFRAGGFQALVSRAVHAARERGHTLSTAND